jgi:hypothetical protein
VFARDVCKCSELDLHTSDLFGALFAGHRFDLAHQISEE